MTQGEGGAGISPGWQPGRGPSRPASDPAAPSLGATTIGRYVVTGELGRGGMGVVLRARDPHLQRDVAIKMILDERAGGDPLRHQRFVAEARAVARLRHPGIVTVHEVGTHEGRPFIVMDLLEGETLEEHLERASPPPRRVAEIVREVAAALHHAHRAGVVHRDVKPQNVLLDADGRPHLLDFGLARDLADDHHLTRTGQLVGTPAYVAPEQASGGRRGAAGPAADVWSAGAVLYRALVGRPPFQAGNILELIRKIFMEDPVPPRSIVASVPADLATVALRCLEKDPTRRYASAGDLADDLGRFLAGEPVLARPAGPARRAVRWVRAHRGLALLGLVAVIAIVAGGGFLAATRVAVARRLAEERARVVTSARDAADRALAVLRAAREEPLAADAGPGARRAHHDALLARGLEAVEATATLRALALEDPAAKAAAFEAAMALGEVALAAKQWSVAASAFGKAAALGIDDAVARAALVRLAQARDRAAAEVRDEVEGILAKARRGELDARVGSYDAALFALVRLADEQTVRLLSAALDEVTVELRRATREIYLGVAEPSDIEQEQGWKRMRGLEPAVDAWLSLAPGEPLPQPHVRMLARAERRLVFRVQAGLAREATVPSPLELVAAAQTRHLAGMLAGDRDASSPAARGERISQLVKLCCDALGRIGIADPAIDALGRYLVVEADSVRAISAGLALCLLGGDRVQGIVAVTRDRFGLSSHFWERVRRHVPAAPAPDGGASAAEWLERGLAHLGREEPGEALAALDRALAIDPDDPEAIGNRGLARFQMRDYAGAIVDFDRALEIYPRDATVHSNRAQAKLGLGDLAGALADSDRATSLAPHDPAAWNGAAIIRVQAGRIDEAISAATQAIRLDQRFARAWAGRASAHLARGDIAAALADLEEAVRLEPDDAALRSSLGNVYGRQGRYKEALAQLDRAIELEPGYPIAWCNRGSVRNQAGDALGGIADLEHGLALEPALSIGWINLAEARWSASDVEGSFAALARAEAIDPNNFVIYYNRANKHEQRQDLARAFADLDRLIELHPLLGHRARGFVRWRAIVELRREDLRAGAIADLERCLQLAPNDPEAPRVRAALAELRGGR